MNNLPSSPATQLNVRLSLIHENNSSSDAKEWPNTIYKSSNASRKLVKTVEQNFLVTRTKLVNLSRRSSGCRLQDSFIFVERFPFNFSQHFEPLIKCHKPGLRCYNIAGSSSVEKQHTGSYIWAVELPC